jgi:hypothetical protein
VLVTQVSRQPNSPLLKLFDSIVSADNTQNEYHYTSRLENSKICPTEEPTILTCFASALEQLCYIARSTSTRNCSDSWLTTLRL